MSDGKPSDLEIKLAEMDGFRRTQVIHLSDALAQANGELAVLRAKIGELEKPAELGP